MDSKLRRMAIGASMAVILLVSLLVWYANKEDTPAYANKPVNASATAETSNAASNGTGDGAQTRADNAQAGADNTQTGVGNTGTKSGDLSAFLRDSTFFDEEKNPVLEAAKDQSNSLSLIVTSVEKDLRIQVVDKEGILVTGQSFYVKVDGLGEYKDLDQDGVIYIGDVAAGEYYVQLLPIEGYRVPVSGSRIRVKDKVEYLAINDISLLIKTEDEVDSEAEDTGVQGALEDADSSEIKKFRIPDGNAQIGIDVSKWNGDIDWQQVKEAGVEFAIIRAGYRGSVTGSLIEDPYFQYNMRAAANAGIPTGVYFFTQAVNEVEAVEEASAVLNLIAEYHLEYPIYIDTEGAGGNGRADNLDPETRTLVCEAFCRTITNAGYSGGVYASRNWLTNNLDTEKLQDYRIWLAEYRSVPQYQGYYHMWQYTSKGKIGGISGNVDINISYENE